MWKLDPQTILEHFYPEDTPLRRLLILHSLQVRSKALAILAQSGVKANAQLVADAAMLHDIGIGRCHAPSILCEGTSDYLAHGTIGAAMLREYGAQHGLDLEKYARVCERHTGSGLSAADVREQKLPIPEQDYLPETVEEKLVCLADKFFSKSGDREEKSLASIHHSMEKFGRPCVKRFEELCRCFGLTE